MNKFSIISVALALLLPQSHALRPARLNARGDGVKLMQAEDVITSECVACETNDDCDGGAGKVCKEGCCEDHDHAEGHPKDRVSGSEAGQASNPACGTCTECQYDSPGCSVQAIEDHVCGIDPYCCDFEWDSTCVDMVWEHDMSCWLEEGEECVLNCGRAHFGLGCEVPAIEECVCSHDPWCCNDAWDSFCVEQMWHAPCHIDCDCSENERGFSGGAALPSYWETLGNSRTIDTSLLGFNVASRKWCYDHSNTCVKWGERSDSCDATQFLCAGHTTSPPTIGYGSEQIDAIAEMLSMGDRQHYMCPDCFFSAACESGELPGTDNEVTATYTDCQCDEHHSGFHLIPEGYWWDVASNAGLDPSLVTQRAGKWYYNEVDTCVGVGSYGDACDSGVVVCAGDGIFGSGDDQMALVADANTNGGAHADCPP